MMCQEDEDENNVLNLLPSSPNFHTNKQHQIILKLNAIFLLWNFSL